MFITGIVLVVLGLVFFLQNTGFIPFDTWNNIWPVLLVLLGLGLMFTRRGYYGMKEGGWSGDMGWRKREDKIMGGTESRAYGHGKDEKKEGMHDNMDEEDS